VLSTNNFNKAMTMNAELEPKFSRIEKLLTEHTLDALVLRRVANFAWLTGGAASYVNTADIYGVASLLITPAGRFLVTNNIEAPRFREEEALETQGWQFLVVPWYQADETLADRTKGLRLGVDWPYPGAVDLSAALTPLRASLSPNEQARFRTLARGCAEAMDQAIRQVKPGMNEFKIAAVLGEETQARGILPIVKLVATDQRIYAYRHPLPVDKKLDRYAMLVLCGRQYGLVCSLTRLVHFGPLPEELQVKEKALAEVDAAFIHATRPGRTLGDIFVEAQQAYATVGYPEEWRLHHQGGLTGYLPREAIAVPGSPERVSAGQVYAWNPSITGTKSEDTILVGEGENDILTAIPGWPVIQARAGDQEIPRPAILTIS
jgi:antitoxin VapB